MITGPDNLFALAELAPLLRDELARLTAQAARQPGGHALVVQACAANRELALDTRHLRAVRVHAERKSRLAGDVVCETDALPWENDAFQLVLVQHAGEVLAPGGALVDELARVLAPGGSLLWFALNPWSPWLAWNQWQARRGVPMPRPAHVDAARKRMHACQLATRAPEYLGTCWPQRGAESVAIHRSRLLAPLRHAYLISASKQRAVLTPLRPRLVRERTGISPQLALPSRRASA